MDVWDNENLDLGDPAHVTFEGANGGAVAFVAVAGELDIRCGARDGAACAEFSWGGADDGKPASARGWAALGTAGRLVGRPFIHRVDDSGVSERD